LESVGVDINLLWSRIYDIFIKTIIAIDTSVNDSSRRYGIHRNNCFELFGFDIIIDSNLKPWLLEVNLSPSLATDSPLDHHIKSNLIADLMNIIGIRAFDRKKESINRARSRIRAKQSLASYSNKAPNPQVSVFMHSNRFKAILRELLEEEKRMSNFIRIFPAKGSDYYF